MTNENLVTRFFQHVSKTETCWLWTGGKNSGGYGYFSISRKDGNIRAHRFSWELHFGKVLEWLCVCHTCDNPLCVNPAHLWLGTPQKNMEDMIQKGRNGNSSKTHCPQGHEYTPENTIYYSYRNCTRGRKCRTCHNEQRRIKLVLDK